MALPCSSDLTIGGADSPTWVSAAMAGRPGLEPRAGGQAAGYTEATAHCPVPKQSWEGTAYSSWLGDEILRLRNMGRVLICMAPSPGPPDLLPCCQLRH